MLYSNLLVFSVQQKKYGKHIEAGAKKAILSAPAKDDMPTFVMGVNHDTI